MGRGGKPKWRGLGINGGGEKFGGHHDLFIFIILQINMVPVRYHFLPKLSGLRLKNGSKGSKCGLWCYFQVFK